MRFSQTSSHAAPRRDVGLHPGRVDIFVGGTLFRASPNKREFEFVTVTLLIRGDEHFTPVSPCSLTIFEKCLLCVCAPTQGKARKVRRQIRPNPVHPPSRLRASGKSSESRRKVVVGKSSGGSMSRKSMLCMKMSHKPHINIPKLRLRRTRKRSVISPKSDREDFVQIRK